MLIDAHAHLQNLTTSELEDTLKLADEFNIKKVIVNATCEADWEKVLALKSPPILPQLGLHPWYVENASNTWLKKLTSLLQENKNCGVGEIGLDRSSKYKESYKKQLAAFEAQLKLAATFNRPVSIHCLKSWDDLIRILKQYKLKILFHGFYASSEITKELLKFEAFFSFSAKVLTLHPHEKIARLLEIIPDNRLLVESDDVPSKLNETVELLSKIKGIDLRDILTQNGATFSDFLATS